MSNFADLLCNSPPVGLCVRKWWQAGLLCFLAAHTWPLITLGLFALFLFPERQRPEGRGPKALQHVLIGLQHRCKCHTVLASSLEVPVMVYRGSCGNQKDDLKIVTLHPAL